MHCKKLVFIQTNSLLNIRLEEHVISQNALTTGLHFFALQFSKFLFLSL